MSYQVIARKYRPQRFSEVVGQEHVTQTLTNAIAQKRIAHAYLFVGPRGTGKTTVARIFAKCLNCTGGPRVDFPDDDPRAKEIAEGRALDVLEIDGASNRGIDEIRELRETVKFAPASAKFKIYIIDEVHMLTKEAFNALLKTLEEPPEHVKFMFATTEPEKVLPTILSRCQRFDLRRIPAALIVKHLGEIAQMEKVTIDDAALYAIARGAEGGMRDAESTLDQLISFCGETIQENDVLSMFGLAARGQILGLSEAILAGQAEEALKLLNELSKNGKDLGRLLSDVLGHFRNLLIYLVASGDLSLLEASEAEIAALKSQSQGVRAEALTRVLDVLTEAEGRMRDAASKKIFLELTLLRAIEARNAVSIDAVLATLGQLRSGESAAGTVTGAAAVVKPAPVVKRPVEASREAESKVVAETKASPPPAVQERVAGMPVATETVTEAVPESVPLAAGAGEPALQSVWSEMVEAVGRASPFLKTYLLESHPVSFNKKLFVLGFDPEFRDHLGLVDNAKNRAILETKLHEMGHRDAQVKFVEAAGPPRAARPVATAEPVIPKAAKGATPAAGAAKAVPAAAPLLNKEDFKNDPLIQKALEIFKGQIVEVRA